MNQYNIDINLSHVLMTAQEKRKTIVDGEKQDNLIIINININTKIFGFCKTKQNQNLYSPPAFLTV